MIGNFTEVKPLRYWVQHILPLVYDESLSYMELLGKVVNTLNEVVKNNNLLPDYIMELIKKYISSGEIEKVLAEVLANYMLNVKFPPSGLKPATGDGSADDTEAIQGCIDYAYNNGGMSVYFPSGSYLTQPLTLRNKATLFGQDRYTTRLVMKGGATTAMFTGDVDELTLTGLGFDGNMDIQVNNVNLFTISVNSAIITNCLLTDGYDLLNITVNDDLQLNDIIFRHAVENALVLKGEGIVQGNNLIFKSVSSLVGKNFVVMDVSDSILEQLKCYGASPNAVLINGNNNIVKMWNKQSLKAYTDNGVNNTVEVYTQSEQKKLTGFKTTNVNGDLAETIGGNAMETVTGNKNVTAHDITETANGVRTENTTGNRNETTEGNLIEKTEGNATETVTGDKAVSSQNYNETVTNNKVVSSQNYNETVMNNKVVSANKLTETVTTEKVLNAKVSRETLSAKNEAITGDKVVKAANVTEIIDGDKTVTSGNVSITSSNITTHTTQDLTEQVDGVRNITVTGANNETTGTKTETVNGNKTETVTGNKEVNANNLTENITNKKHIIAGSVTEDITGDKHVNTANTIETVQGDKTVTAGDISETAVNKTVHVTNDNTEQTDGARTLTVTGLYTENNVNRITTIKGKWLVNFPNRTFDMETIPSVNVKDYGAIGDGVADDSSAIMAMITALGYAFFTPGTYLTNLDFTAPITLIGCNSNTCILKAKDPNKNVVTFSSYCCAYGLTFTGGLNGLECKNATGNIISACTAEKNTQYGFFINGKALAWTDNSALSGLSYCYARLNGKGGIVIKDYADWKMDNCECVSNTDKFNTNSNVEIINGAGKMINCHFWNYNDGSGFKRTKVSLSLTDCRETEITNCHIEGGYDVNISIIGTSSPTFVNCLIYNSFGAYSIWLTSNHVKFIGCVLRTQAPDEVSYKPKWGAIFGNAGVDCLYGVLSKCEISGELFANNFFKKWDIDSYLDFDSTKLLNNITLDTSLKGFQGDGRIIKKDSFINSGGKTIDIRYTTYGYITQDTTLVGTPYPGDKMYLYNDTGSACTITLPNGFPAMASLTYTLESHEGIMIVFGTNTSLII